MEVLIAIIRIEKIHVWFIEPKKGCIYHTGDNGGFKILASRYPKKDTVVLVFAARTDWDRYELKSQIEKIYSLLD